MVGDTYIVHLSVYPSATKMLTTFGKEATAPDMTVSCFIQQTCSVVV